ncbi:MAG: RNA polymerase sigma factor [Prolixibacteraceae bacterium]|nr:RNA polymerase sigma factor [Prolixibacteraceae bacterium]
MDLKSGNTTIPEADLITGCIKGNRIIQKALYDRFCKPMFSLAYRMLNDWDLAHDVLQDAFIEVFKSIHQLKNKAVLESWIRTIVVRSAIAKIRERKKMIFESLPNIETAYSFDDSFTGEQLDKAIRSLPEGNRMVFVLIEVEGYKHREVAELMNISEGTSKSQLNYAKTILKKKLAEFRNG